MPVPDLRLAICRRCRSEDRIASGAASDVALEVAARAYVAQHGLSMHVRRSQCLSCCDGGHTVRVERYGVEIALVGIRTVAELETVLASIDDIATRNVPAALQSRLYQVWVDGDLVWHRQLGAGDAQGADVSK